MELRNGDPETSPPNRQNHRLWEVAGYPRLAWSTPTASLQGPENPQGGLRTPSQLQGGLPAGHVGRGQLLESARDVEIMPEVLRFPHQVE